jgi:DNA-directed RNA polymerase subunit beta'
VKGEGAETFRQGGLVETSPGRVMFNDILPKQDVVLQSDAGKQGSGPRDFGLLSGARTSRDDRAAGPHEERGFPRFDGKRSVVRRQRPENRAEQGEGDRRIRKEVLKLLKNYERGVITNQERYNKVLDIWTHAREEITKSMMEQLKDDVREEGAYVNPIYLMATLVLEAVWVRFSSLRVCEV